LADKLEAIAELDLEVQERLRAEGTALPVIATTGYGDVPLAERAMRAGAVDFVEKPLPRRKFSRLSTALASIRSCTSSSAASKTS
jgi:two-component system response regulator FixJ